MHLRITTKHVAFFIKTITKDKHQAALCGLAVLEDRGVGAKELPVSTGGCVFPRPRLLHLSGFKLLPAVVPPLPQAHVLPVLNLDGVIGGGVRPLPSFLGTAVGVAWDIWWWLESSHP